MSVTVKQLLEALKKLDKLGKGNLKVLIPVDEEGNSYYEAIATVTLVSDMFEAQDEDNEFTDPELEPYKHTHVIVG